MSSAEYERRYEELYDAFYNAVLSYALRRHGVPAGAEDVATETFLVAWRRIGEVPGDDGQAFAWLLGVARWVLVNTRRGDVRRDRLLARLHRMQSREPVDNSLEEALVADDGHATVLAGLTRLRPAEVEILQLAVWEQLSHAQIAVVMDLSVNAVAIRLHRARQSLRAELQKVGYGEKDQARPGHSSLAADESDGE